MKFKIPSIIKNSYIIILTLFAIWMLFFDSNSTLVHIELNEKIEKLENEAKYYKAEIKKDESELSKIQTDSGLEKYAREVLFMKKENEDIYIIEYDTIK
ncbi:MAG: septum formation initiator family protein [Flavobacteriaceae bacterium]|nr:septum formation initiator family protein [Flavobacteriaceae bacterium]